MNLLNIWLLNLSNYEVKKLKFKKHLILLIFTLILISGQTAEASSVKIWDTIIKDTGHKFYGFESSYAWGNKDNWVQVPYGTLDYNFIGNQVIENGNFWFFIHDSGFDSPFMYANMGGSPGPVGEMYIKTTIDGKDRWNFYIKSVIITKNTPEELILIVDSGYTPGINVIQYKIKEDSHYIEAKAMTDHYFIAGFHSSPNRFAVAPIKIGAGTDFVVDPRNYSNIPEGKHIFFYPDEQYENMMFQEINFGGWFFDHIIIYDDWTFAKPSIEVYKENDIMRLGSIRAHMQSGRSNERVFFAQINKENIFLEESPNKAISAGGSYTSVRHPTIPGRWRISGRVRAADGSEQYYTQDVYDQNFVFVSPISGTLEAVALYLYDRTSETPSDITTPMDVYRDITGQTTTVSNPAYSIPSGTYPNSQSISISTSTAGATIRYTIDGTTPTTTSSIYSTPVVISSTTTLKARAWKTGLTPSGIATAAYIIGTQAQAPAPVLSSIKNPGFESGTTPWLFYTSGTGTFSTVSPGHEGSNMGRLALSSGGSNIQLYQTGIALEPNTRYRLNFAAYSTTGHDVTVRLLKHVSPYTAYAPDFTANLGTSWQTFTTEFTTSGLTGTVNDGRLQFKLAPFAKSGNTYYIDDVRLEKVSAIELPSISTHPADQTVATGQTATFSVVATGTAPLTYQWQKNSMNIPGATNPSYTTPATILADSGSKFRVLVTNPAGSIMSNAATCTLGTQAPVISSIMNPGFESGTTPWKFYTSGTGTFSTVSPGYEGSNTAQLALSSSGSNIQLYQEGITLEPNTRYRLSFAAYSTTGHDVTVRLFKHVSPYTNYGLGFTANLGTNWQTFTTEFTTSGFTSTVNDGRLKFWLAPFAASGDNYYIDNVQLEKI